MWYAAKNTLDIFRGKEIAPASTTQNIGRPLQHHQRWAKQEIYFLFLEFRNVSIWFGYQKVPWLKKYVFCEFYSNFFIGLYKYFLPVFSVADCNEEDKKPPWYLVEGAKALSAALKTWTHKREVGCIGRKLKYQEKCCDFCSKWISYKRANSKSNQNSFEKKNAGIKIADIIIYCYICAWTWHKHLTYPSLCWNVNPFSLL